jgi:predicted nicotinamide N-methyase
LKFWVKTGGVNCRYFVFFAEALPREQKTGDMCVSENDGPHSQLPAIPGGWTERCIDVGWRRLEITLPAEPDEFLDDPEVLAANRRDDYMPYWAYLWPSSIAMARWLPAAGLPAGTGALELGSGIGLTGLAALAAGWDVTFSDYDAQALALCRHNAGRNGFPRIRTRHVDWRKPLPDQYPVIFGCEVTYDASSHEPLLRLIRQMLAPEGRCWLGDPGRSQGPQFAALAAAQGFSVIVRDAANRPQPTALRGEFQVFELRCRSGE